MRKSFSLRLIRLSMVVSICLSSSQCAWPKTVVISPEEEKSQVAADFARQGLDYFLHGRFFEAERSFRFAIQTVGRTPSLEFNLALSLERQGSLYEAGSILESLTQQAPREPLYWAARARLSAANGEIIEAIGFYNKAIQVGQVNNIRNSNNENYAGEPFDIRGLLIAKSGLEESVGLAEDAVCSSEEAYLRSPSPLDLDRYIDTLLGFGRLQQAFERSTFAIRSKEVPNPSVELIRAIVFYFIQTGRCDDAVLWLERAGRTGLPEGSVSLDFDLSLMFCGKDPRFYGDEPSADQVVDALKEKRRAKTPFGLSWPPKLLDFALEKSKE